MNLRQAAQRALKAMEDGEYRADMIEFSDALIALRAALAEPEQEPVAWMDIDDNGQRLTVRQWSDGNKDEVPLYTAPTPRRPLTDEEIEALWQNTSPYYDHQDFARAIERKHGIGEQQ